jgi:hypothetical protein
MTVGTISGLLLTSILGGLALKRNNRCWVGPDCFKKAKNFFKNDPDWDGYYAENVIISYLECKYLEYLANDIGDEANGQLF